MNAHTIVVRAITECGTLFADSLRDQAKMHYDYAENSTMQLATRGAIAQAKACYRVLEWLENPNDLSPNELAHCIVNEVGPMVIALNTASKLLCIPAHERTAAAIEWQERNPNA